MLNSSEQGAEEKELQDRLEREYPHRKETFTQSSKQQSATIKSRVQNFALRIRDVTQNNWHPTVFFEKQNKANKTKD